MTPIQSTRPVAETLSYRLANSGLFRFFAMWIGGAVAFVIPVMTVLLTDEYAYISGSKGTWLAILGIVTALIYIGIVGGWLGRVMKRAMRDVDAWATAVSAAEAAHPRASRKVSASGMSFLVMLAGLALLLGGSWVWGRFEQPVIGGILAFIGFVIVMKPSPGVGVINRLRHRS